MKIIWREEDNLCAVAASYSSVAQTRRYHADSPSKSGCNGGAGCGHDTWTRSCPEEVRWQLSAVQKNAYDPPLRSHAFD
jgi:hypothetical protein